MTASVNSSMNSPVKTISVVFADDHALVADGMTTILHGVNHKQRDYEFAVVGQASSGRGLLELVKRVSADLAFVDISMPDMSGLDAVPKVREIRPDIKIIVVTMHREPEYMTRALSVGANGYLMKSCSAQEFCHAIDEVMRGNAYVTSLLGSRPGGTLPGSDDEEDQLTSLGMSQRQREVVTLLASGKTIKEIAFQLGLSRKTVEHHKAMFREKFGIDTDADLTKFAIKHGLTGTDWIRK